MKDKDTTNLILLTYKGKALLMYKFENSIDEEIHEWTFIRAIINRKETIQNGLSRTIMNEAGIKVKKITNLSENYYHAELSDVDVNNIKRNELQLLNFFTLSEVQKLHLSTPTRNFVTEFGNLI